MERRTQARLAGGALALLVTVVVFRRTVFAWPDLFLPLSGPRPVTLALVWLLSLALPTMAGGAAAGWLYERFS